MSVSLKWITPDAEQMIAHMARVSNPKAQPDDPHAKLIRYFMDHKEWSPFEMADMCIDIWTTRSISRQILRHRSFHFQEFSQRYAEVTNVLQCTYGRLQDSKNRQNSIETHDIEFQTEWANLQIKLGQASQEAYQRAIKMGVAKELARNLLPEGMTPTHMYMKGTIRDWLFYLKLRCGPETQKEHRDVAEAIKIILAEQLPGLYEAAVEAGIL